MVHLDDTVVSLLSALFLWRPPPVSTFAAGLALNMSALSLAVGPGSAGARVADALARGSARPAGVVVLRAHGAVLHAVLHPHHTGCQRASVCTLLAVNLQRRQTPRAPAHGNGHAARRDYPSLVRCHGPQCHVGTSRQCPPRAARCAPRVRCVRNGSRAHCMTSRVFCRSKDCHVHLCCSPHCPVVHK